MLYSDCYQDTITFLKLESQCYNSKGCLQNKGKIHIKSGPFVNRSPKKTLFQKHRKYHITTAIRANLHGNTRTVVVCVLCMSYSVSGKDLGQERFFSDEEMAVRYDKESVI